MTDIENLTHVRASLADGGEIIVLNTGSLITPEAQAMLGALHSRSMGGLGKHLEILGKKGAENFMASFYVGYGHKSIGDLAHVAIFIEGISMLAAKAIQDFPLYNGQESSTRYIDYAQQRFSDPVNSENSKNILESWRSFYLEGLEIMIAELQERYPRAENEDEKIYLKAIKARAFDTMRAFLTAGATTNIAWYGNVRQMGDRLLTLRHHPLAEVRDIAEKLRTTLLEAHPNSFTSKEYPATEKYNSVIEKQFAYFDDPEPVDFAFNRDSVDRNLLADFTEALATRPTKTELPFAIRECGTAEFRFLLDFGSFRDIQRHRAVVTRMPLLTSAHGFEPWYLTELTPELRARAEDLIKKQLEQIDALNLDPETRQYYLPMGFRTTVRLTGDLRALVYLTEIRATSTVHPTLRMRAKQMSETLLDKYGPSGLVLHIEENADRFDVKRGTHDIVLKD